MSHALLEAWQKTLRLRGDDRAVVQAGNQETITFRELDLRASAWLRDHVPDVTRLRSRAVVFAAPNGLGWLEVFLGLLKAGAVVVPLDAAEPLFAQQDLTTSLRAGFWWDGTDLHALPHEKRYRDPAVCLIKLTSGTTGQPKPLVFTAEQLLTDARQVTTTMGIQSSDLNYALIPLGHSYGLGNLTLPLLAQGVPLVIGSAPLPHAIAADFARWQPTVFPGVPALWRALAAADLKLDTLRLGISAGAPLLPATAREFATRFGRRLHNFYGSSETGGISYDHTGTATLTGRVGSALAGVKLTSKPGERLHVQSAAVLTHGNRRPGRWVMPDRATLDSHGEVTLSGRRGQTVKIAGRRVNLAEVGERLLRLAGVRQAWVGLSVGDDPVLQAVVGTERKADELRAELLGHTAAWKVPRKILVLSALPLTSRGKIDTRILQAMSW